jgi:hypothetical protein
MDLLRSQWTTLCAAALLGFAFVCPTRASAQLFGEIAGGSNFVPTLPSGATYASGSNFRVSVGWKVAQNFSWRLDAFTSQFDSKDHQNLPCPTFGCPASAYINDEHITGLTANVLLSVDPRGIFYLIGGAGYYNVNNAGLTVIQPLFGLSAGAGIAIPMGARLRGVVEARWHGLVGATAGPTWLMPVMIGLRY